jgi:hypothetical protein
MASLDIIKIYSNIPVTETKAILTNMVKDNFVEPQTQSEIIRSCDVITKHNYFTHYKNMITQQDGINNTLVELEDKYQNPHIL